MRSARVKELRKAFARSMYPQDRNGWKRFKRAFNNLPADKRERLVPVAPRK